MGYPILITGGSGFIGRNICESFLAEKYSLLAPDRRELDLTDEVSVRSFFARQQFETVIHAAAKPGHRNAADPSGIFHANARMFFNLARNADRFGKMLVIGSGGIYDMRYYQPKMKEDCFDQHVPVDEHGFNKYVCYKYIERVSNIVDLRVFGIFGKYEDYTIRFPSNMVCKAIFDLPLSMKQDRLFDYLFIDDLMPVLDHFICTNTAYKAYNVTPNSAIRLRTIAEKVLAISGKNITIVTAKEGMGSEYSGDNSRLRAEIPGLSFTNIDNALVQLYDWYGANKAMIDRNVLLADK